MTLVETPVLEMPDDLKQLLQKIVELSSGGWLWLRARSQM